MCCPTVSGSFITFTLITMIALFTLTLLNMIFSILTPRKEDAFVMPKYEDYKSPVTITLLDNLKFGQTLQDKNNYGLTGSSNVKKCFTGMCSTNGRNYLFSANCTKACFASLSECYNQDGQKCVKMECDKSDSNFGECIMYNTIYNHL